LPTEPLAPANRHLTILAVRRAARALEQGAASKPADPDPPATGARSTTGTTALAQRKEHAGPPHVTRQ
jgi:hypothetical protein